MNGNDYEVYSEYEIFEISEKGLVFKNGYQIDFSVCAENFKREYPESRGQCVGERDMSTWHFMFYDAPKSIMVKFIPKNRLREFFSKNNTPKRFTSLQNKILEYGYTTYDMS